MSLVDQAPAPPDRTRIGVAMAAVLLAAVLLVGRLWYLQIAHGDELLAASEQNRTRVLRRVPPRGVILDARGKVLASTRARVVLRLMPEEHDKNPWVLGRLAELLDCSKADLEEAYQASKIDSFQPVLLQSDVGLEAATRIEEHRYALPGVTIGPEPMRSYSVGEAFGHVLGYVGECSERDLKERARYGYARGDTCGKTGVEGGAYDGLLRGHDGAVTVEVDALGRIRGELWAEDPLPGALVRLTIASDLQVLAYQELRAHLRRGRSAAAVAMDPNTGAVLAMASVPSFDPRDFAAGITRKRWNALQTDPLRPLINRAVGSASAPGSVFKVITALAGLETGRTSVHDSTYCSGVIHLGRWPKRCHRRSGHGAVGFTEGIAKSCDVFFYRLGQRLGPERIAAYARLMGLGSRTGIDIAGGEVAGIVPDPAWKRRRGLGPWVGGDTVDYAIGQAMLACTPLQLCAATCAIANGGTLYKPHLVGKVTTYGPERTQHEDNVQPTVVRRLGFKPSSLAAVQRAMEAVVAPGGTGARCAIPGVRTAGKTGTAQRRRRGEMVNDAWFVGYAPAEKPTIAVCVYVEEGGHGGETAAPIARALMAHHLRVKLTDRVEAGWADD